MRLETVKGISVTPILLPAVVGILILLCLIVLILSYYRKMMIHKTLTERETKYQKDLLSASLEIAERERANIAANVHDEIGIMLHVFKQNISRIKRNPEDKELISSLLDETDQEISRTIHITRSIANELMPASLGNIGFVESIECLCDYFNSTQVIKLTLRLEVEHLELEKSTSIHLYRLVKEVMNNVIKHTKARNAELMISLSKNLLNITIGHDGTGISNEAVNKLIESSKGIGLRSIMGRAQLINASVQYVIVDQNLSRIIIEIPLP